MESPVTGFHTSVTPLQHLPAHDWPRRLATPPCPQPVTTVTLGRHTASCADISVSAGRQLSCMSMPRHHT